MRKITGKNTKPELALRKALYSLGIRYRLHDKRLVGKPDIVLHKYRTVVFVDGDWWHGRNYEAEHKKYSAFWQNKISQNMARDKSVNHELMNEGWDVVRLWEKDILKNPLRCAENIKEFLDSKIS